MSPPKVIVFGATGGVGSAAARTAQAHGASVVLALRDTTKKVPGLSAEDEKTGAFQRVQGDLSKPGTLHDAVAATGATRAFIYMVHDGVDDHLRAALTALKAAGVEFVVFLSSYGVQGDIRAITPATFIPYAHAQVEIALEEVFGPGTYVALRPAYFASNSLQWGGQIRAGTGEVTVPYPSAEFDWVVPEDIGRVAGSLLARGALKTTAASPGDGGAEDSGRSYLYLMGPEMISQADVLQYIGDAVGRDIHVEAIVDDDEATEFLIAAVHVPDAGARGLVSMLRNRAAGTDKEFERHPDYKEMVDNVAKYGGKQPTLFREWLQENKDLFRA
ncbi:hypothetical protein B0T26DRAFT_870034 [Lasiosphaeria miniovina]|uniref:NmrA-like domain-containing protein n=1 Tax=Lasiosphaeria miniovina TaxID=1954250 RepID=A0AA40ATN3_9PEZI|nr:uncharacterized protein B0T26DRAFT_870034 [Lasiosphaeria miniovina]KAK0721825.1 hypothetical protein B0T26DRAFT_870034 [Lasiosphaeria miniovina]